MFGQISAAHCVEVKCKTGSFFALAMLIKSNTVHYRQTCLYITRLIQTECLKYFYKAGTAVSVHMVKALRSVLKGCSICTRHREFSSNTTAWMSLMDSVMTMCSGSVKITPQPPHFSSPHKVSPLTCTSDLKHMLTGSHQITRQTLFWLSAWECGLCKYIHVPDD